MDIEHCDRLSWFLRWDESQEQNGERTPFAALPQTRTASIDLVMARAFLGTDGRNRPAI
jgi:hypothetical protein